MHRAIPLRHLHLGVFQTHDALLDAVGHRRLGGLGPEAVHQGLESIDLLGLALSDLGQADLVFGAVGEVLGVGALVFLHGAEAGVVVSVEMQHARDGFVEQVEVVADHQQRAPITTHEAQQPLLGIAVQVVGGLIKEKDVAAGEEDPGNLHPAPLPARECPHRQFEAVGFETQARRDAQRFALR